MKSHTFLPTFLRYSFTALFSLWIVYLLANMHINQIPGFSLQEGFMIAGELLVFCAIILAFKDSRPTMFDMLHESLEDFAQSIHDHNEKERAELEKMAMGGMTKEELIDDSRKIPDWLQPTKKTTKGIPLSEEHKKKISESLKRKNAEKKAQAARIARTAAASANRKTTKKR